MSEFLHEADVHEIAARAGLVPPRHGWLGAPLPFEPGEPVVLKGLAERLWHKSELGALAFLPFGEHALEASASAMRDRVEAAGHPWIGGLVCERIAMARSDGLPSEAFVSLSRKGALWTIVIGLGGLQVEALGALIPPLCWPVSGKGGGVGITRQAATQALSGHLLGQIWLGRLRGSRPLTTEAQLRRFVDALFTLVELADAEGLTLVEMNPVALDTAGEPRPLDGVGQRETRQGGIDPVGTAHAPPPAGFLRALLSPRRVAVAGVSAKADNVGHLIVDNLRAAGLRDGDLLVVKPARPGEPQDATFLGLACIPDVAAIASAPVDLLLVALPAESATVLLEQLVAQGGGATVVALVAGGLGDGADHTGLGLRVRALLDTARTAGRWTPAVLGPNFLGHVVPGARVNSTFIPGDRWPTPAHAGALALLTQSGAFMLSRLGRAPELPIGLSLALGNQLDVGLGDVLEALEQSPELRAVAAYVEGFGPGELEHAASAAQALVSGGRRVLLYRAGRTDAGQAAAASHTGAVAGDLVLEEAILRQAGVTVIPTIAAFDSAIAWLGRFPTLTAGPVAVVSNAGFETVSAADRLGLRYPPATLTAAETDALRGLIERHGLLSLVSPRLPLDLTPMASLDAYRDATKLLLDSAARVVIVGLVPFSRRLDFHGDAPWAAASALAKELRATADAKGKAVAAVVDAGPEWAPLAAALAAGGLPVFGRMEDAMAGLQTVG